jgi:hypothetical protein
VPAQISALPTPPSANDPANFNTRADTFLAALPAFATQANTVANEIAASAQSASNFASTASAKAAEATGQANQAAVSAASALSAPGTNGTSATSLTIGAGAKTFTTQTGKAWVAGQGFFLASSASPTNWMTGVLTSYNSGTGAATVQVDTIGGSGTFAAWNCGLAAGRSLPMASQAQAEAGADNASWMSPLATSQAIAAQAFPVGSLIDKSGSLGASWLPCTGLNYLNSAYPALSGLMPPYVNPMTLRLAAAGTNQGAYGGGVFVQWIYNGSAWQLYTSTDAVAWTLRTNPFGSAVSPYTLGYMNGGFVGVTNSAIYLSADGVTWAARTFPATLSSSTGLVYAFGLYILIGFNTSSAGGIWTSPDLVTWTVRTIPNSLFPNSLAYDATLGKVLAVGTSGPWWVSSNGTTWASTTGQPSLNGYGVVSMGGKFFVSGNNPSVGGPMYALTSDLTTWDTSVTSGANAVFGTVQYASWTIWDGARLFAAQGGILGCSSDGAAWTALSSGVTTINSIMRAGPALTTPTVIGAGAQGIRSGLDTSTTQFTVPTIAARASGFSCFIKAL